MVTVLCVVYGQLSEERPNTEGSLDIREKKYFMLPATLYFYKYPSLPQQLPSVPKQQHRIRCKYIPHKSLQVTNSNN